MMISRITYFFILLFCCACSYLPEDFTFSDDIQVSETSEYIFLESAATDAANTLFIYYPGGLVDPHAYISMLEGVVKEGYPTLILKVTANLAITNTGKAKKAINDYEQYENYVLGGHSLGAAVTCIAANNDRDLFSGLVVMAGYPTENASLADWDDGSILVFDATEDEVIDRETLETARAFFPPITKIKDAVEIPESPRGQTLWVEVLGGNHGQYGDYGMQAGDGVATITTEAQHEVLQEYILEYFRKNNW